MTNADPQAMHRLQQAEQMLRSGRLQEAEKICRAVLLNQRDHPAALQLLGLALAQSGDLGGAELALRRSVALSPRTAAAHSNLGNLLLMKQDAAGAEACYRKAVELNPRHAEAHFNLGLTLKKLSRNEDAVTTLREAVRLRPEFPDALTQLGSTMLALNDYAAALDVLDRARKMRANHYETEYNHGLVLMALGRYDEAVESLSRATTLRANSHEAFFALGHSLHHTRNYRLAVPALMKAVSLKPDDARSHSALASALLDLGRPHEALEAVNRAIKLGGDISSFHIVLGRVLGDLNRVDDMVLAHQRAVELAPDSAEAHNFLGNAYLSLGRSDEARACFEKALALRPDAVRTHYNLARLGRFKPDDPRIAALEDLAARSNELQPADRVWVQFGLGRAYDELGDYDRAFEHFSIGNRMQADKNQLDEKVNQERFELAKSIFTADFVRERVGVGSPSDLPICIVGMPRTGTTLIEQILSSHPKVAGAGEVLELDVAVETARARYRLEAPYPQLLRDLPPEGFRLIGDTYAGRLAKRVPEAAPHVTDKLPGNFHNIGLIHLALPNAKIIHCIRNPVDTCLSSFTNLFGVRLAYFNDLAALGRFYRRYHDLMAHWRAILPPGAFLDVVYEDLIADFEPGDRRIIEFCGLEWDPRCLDFHVNARAVNTVSVTQVRQKVYSSSVDRWRRYEKFLGPLFEGLGDLAPR